MKTWAKIGIAVGAVGLVGLLIWANLRNASPADANAAATAGGDGPAVNVQKVQPGPLRITVLAPGTVQAMKDTDLRAGIASTGITLRVKVGDKVDSGQVIAQLDTVDLQQQLIQQQSQLSQAQSQLAQLQRQSDDGGKQATQQVNAADWELKTARANLTATQQSLNQQADSTRQALEQAQRDLASLQQSPTPSSQDDAQRQADQLSALQQKIAGLQSQLATLVASDNPTLVQAQVRVDTDVAALKRAQDQLSKPAVLPEQISAAQQAVSSAVASVQHLQDQIAQGVIKAPFAGIILAVDMKDGQPVQPGARIAELGVMDTVLAKIHVDEIDIGRVAVDQAVTLRSVAFPDDTFTGKVTRVYPQAEASAPTAAAAAKNFTVEAEVQNPGAKLRAGMSTDGEISVAERENALSAGLESLVEEGKHTYLWVVKNGVVHKVEVEVGLRSKTQAEIIKGLAAGDQVVVGPFATMKTLTDGMSVNATVLPPHQGGGV